jgi:hypothetical protein
MNMTDYTYIDTAEVAKLIRGDLKAKFSAQKFSVKSSRYAGGSSIDVSWQDGPTAGMVDAVIKHYAGASFDSMIDLKTSHTSIHDGKPVRFGSDYVFSSRDYSVNAFTAAVKAEIEYWGVSEAVEIKTTSSGSPYIQDLRVSNANEWLQVLVMRRLYETDLTNGWQDVRAIEAERDAEPTRNLAWNDFDYNWREDTNVYPFEYNPGRIAYVCAVCGLEVTQNIVHQDSRQFHESCFDRTEAYRQKVAARYERLLQRAEKLEAEANAGHEQAHQMASYIPFGQPILVGHHSEKSDRRYRDRIHRTFERSFESYKKAERLKERANAARKNRAISSDDPEAVIKLLEKLERLQTYQAEIVRINAVVRQVVHKPRETAAQKEARRLAHVEAMNSSNQTQALNALHRAEREEEDKRVANYPSLAPELAKQAGISETLAAKLLTPDFAGRIGIPDFEVKNNGAEIRRIKERIEMLRKQATQATQGNTEIEYTGNITLTLNREDNRVQISFPGKPAESVRKLLRSYGFVWSPSNLAWQRQLNQTAEWNAKTVLENIGATPIVQEQSAAVEVIAAVDALTASDFDYTWQGDTNVYPFEFRQPVVIKIESPVQRFTIVPMNQGGTGVKILKLLNGRFEHCWSCLDGKSVYENYEKAREHISQNYANAVIFGAAPEPEEEAEPVQQATPTAPQSTRLLRHRIRANRAARANMRITKRNGKPMY